VIGPAVAVETALQQPGLARARHRLAHLHVSLRTEGDTPLRRALAVGLGTLIGCTPFYGLHLLLSTLLARLLGLSRVITYLAANLNNPLTLPFLLWLELGLGRWLRTGAWPELAMAELRRAGLLGVGRDVLLGSVALGLTLGAVLAVLTYALGDRGGDDGFAALREAAAEPYLHGGIAHWEFVRGKLRYDPVYRHLLDSGLLPRPGRLVDLGCGRGILLALLSAPVDEWLNAPPHSASTGPVRVRHVPPPGVELIGVELNRRLVRAARRALEGAATVLRGDLTRCEVPACATAVLLDVLHYLPAAAQEELLDRVVAALGPRGVLILREADGDGGLHFTAVRATERLRALGRLHLRQRFHYRGRAAWEALLAARGLAVETLPVREGTPFANVLLVGRKGR
jgi:uncharacterized protein (DUF2062 family)/trans-aconitate methyltransferase